MFVFKRVNDPDNRGAALASPLPTLTTTTTTTRVKRSLLVFGRSRARALGPLLPAGGTRSLRQTTLALLTAIGIPAQSDRALSKAEDEESFLLACEPSPAGGAILRKDRKDGVLLAREGGRARGVEPADPGPSPLDGLSLGMRTSPLQEGKR